MEVNYTFRMGPGLERGANVNVSDLYSFEDDRPFPRTSIPHIHERVKGWI